MTRRTTGNESLWVGATIERATGRPRTLLLLSIVISIALADAVSADHHGGDGHSDEAPPAHESKPASDDRAVEAKPPDTADEWSPILYVPPNRGRALNTAAGGTRTLTTESGDVTVAVLAPRDHVAFTTRAQPTLYWFVSADTDQRIDLTLVDDDSIDPLLEMTVPAPVRRGIHSLVLAEFGLSLEPWKTYRWHVAIVQDAKRRSIDTLAEGFIERTGITASLERSLRGASTAYGPYALSGIWYDAIDEVLSAIGKDPGNKRLRLQRAAMLEQAELGEIAEYALRADR